MKWGLLLVSGGSENRDREQGGGRVCGGGRFGMCHCEGKECVVK